MDGASELEADKNAESSQTKRRYKEHLYTTRKVKEPERSARRRKLKRRSIQRQGQSESEDIEGLDSDHSSEQSDSSEENSDESSGSQKNSSASEEEQGASHLKEHILEGLVQPLPLVQNEDSEAESDASDNHFSGKRLSGEDTADSLSDGDTSSSSDGDKSGDADDSNTSGDSDTSDLSSDSHVEGSENIMSIVKLYDGSEHSREEVILKVLELFKDPNMTKTLLRKIVSLVHSLLPKPNLFPQTYYFLMKYLDRVAPALKPIKQFYCQKCQFHQGLAQLPACPVCGGKKADSFYMFSVHDSIKNLFEVRKLAKVLNHTPKEDSFICDITDGAEYVPVWKNLNKRDIDITLLWNTDGVQISESSSIDVWPIQFTICEVPRDLREYYLVVCGIYVSDTKPNMNTLLKPFALEMKEIHDKGGVKWKR